MDAVLRPMEDRDLQVTYEWRNDPIVRQFAMSDHTVSWAEHESMYRYNSSLRLIFEFDGVPCGFISCSKDEETTEGTWSFHMAPDSRGKGLSSIMLQMALLYLKQAGYTQIHSEVQINNPISQGLHGKLNFEYVTLNEAGPYFVYVKNL